MAGATARLTRRDLRALVEFLRGSYAIQDLQAFTRHVLSELPTLVRCDINTYNEIDPQRRRITWIADPPVDAEVPDSRQSFERHLEDHPLIAHYQRTGDGRAIKISDFLTRTALHRLGLYNEFFRLFNVEYQLVTLLAPSRPLQIGIALCRSLRDFTERERLVVNLLRPHLIQGYRNAEVLGAMQRELTQVGRALVVRSRDGRGRLITQQARQWIAEYFGNRSAHADRLPDALERWIRHQEALLSGEDDAPPPRTPLVVDRGDGRRLVVRLVSDLNHGVLVLEEQQTGVQPASFEPHGLTRREAEVLARAVEGESNVEISTILGMRPRTVEKHLEHIYQKLGVENRTAAMLWALKQLGPVWGTKPSTSQRLLLAD